MKLIAYWHPRDRGGHRARGRWTRHLKTAESAVALCGHVPMLYAGTQLAAECGDGDRLQGDKASCLRCAAIAASRGPGVLEGLERIAEELDGLGDGQDDYLGKLAVRLRREVVRLRALLRDRAGER